MKRSERLAVLTGLTELVRTRDAARLADLRRREKALVASQADWKKAAAYAPEPADQPIAVGLWQRHALLQGDQVCDRIRRLQPQIDSAVQDLTRSFGRQQALKSVIRRDARKIKGPAGRCR